MSELSQLGFGWAADAGLLAGVDEAGRGPLAGPVVAAAVILDPAAPIVGLNDSKQLSAKRRAELDIEIRARALAFGIGEASVQEIDRINILHATMLAMQRAVAALGVAPAKVLVDGNRCPRLGCAVQAVVGGDRLVPEISAASILAKQARDAQALGWDTIHPGYGFARHKGYGTADHLAALRELGPCPLHRRSFAPVRALLERT